MQVHVGIPGNEAAHKLDKDAKDQNEDSKNQLITDDANAIPRY